jgi:ribulose-phosphate 3-epimerase
MIEVIPAIIAKNFNELKEKVERVKQYVKWVQLDIMDGNFVPNFTWNEPEELKYYDSGVFMEAHLMISEPEKYAEKWIDAGCKRIIFHIEAATDPYEIIRLCREKKVEVGIAINPETPIVNIESLSVDMVAVLGVTPGFGGQEFKPAALSKIKALRRDLPRLTIEVDGGMNPKTARQVIEAGANIIVAGSYIYNSADIKKAIDELKNGNSHSS